MAWYGWQQNSAHPEQWLPARLQLSGVHGRGVYFATSASYSLSPGYAVPDTAGERYLLLVRVLVGEPCLGDRNMERPAQRPNSTELFDSMVDRLQDTKIVVLSAGSDNRAYPEFVLRLGAAEG